VNPAVTCFALIATGAVVFAQKAPVTTPPAPVTTRPTVGTTNTNSLPNNNNTNPNSNSNTTQMPRPIYLSGKVILQDGTPPPDFVKIERVCGGNPRTQGYTDTKGRFQFQVDSMVGIDSDASDPMSRMSSMAGRPTNTSASRGNLAGCDLRAVLPGFVSGTINLTNHNEFDSSDVGTIILKRLGNVDGTTISMSSLHAPKDALKAYEKGRELLRKEKSDDAEKNFQKAVDLYPQYATAWYQLALLQTRDHLELAEASLAKAIEADPKFVSPYISLILIQERNKNWPKAIELSDAVIKLNAIDFPRVYFYKAVAHYNSKEDVAAEKSVRKALELDIRHENPQSEKLLGVILAQHGDLPGGVEHLKKYLEIAPNAMDAPQVKTDLAKLQKQSVAVKEN
jgi:tetratricopeptide (TPR) repeat protein